MAKSSWEIADIIRIQKQKLSVAKLTGGQNSEVAKLKSELKKNEGIRKSIGNSLTNAEHQREVLEGIMTKMLDCLMHRLNQYQGRLKKSQLDALSKFPFIRH